jgi:hypothetical protein
VVASLLGATKVTLALPDDWDEEDAAADGAPPQASAPPRDAAVRTTAAAANAEAVRAAAAEAAARAQAAAQATAEAEADAALVRHEREAWAKKEAEAKGRLQATSAGRGGGSVLTEAEFVDAVKALLTQRRRRNPTADLDGTLLSRSIPKETWPHNGGMRALLMASGFVTYMMGTVIMISDWNGPVSPGQSPGVLSRGPGRFSAVPAPVPARPRAAPAVHAPASAVVWEESYTEVRKLAPREEAGRMHVSPLAEIWVPKAELVDNQVERARPESRAQQSANPEDEEEDAPLDVLAAVDAEDREQGRIMAGSDEEED